MAIRNIRLEKDEILKKKSREIEVIDDKIQTLIDDMIETMYKYNGVGLAAVQVGVLKRVVPSARSIVIANGFGVPSTSLILTMSVFFSRKSTVIYASFWNTRCFLIFFIEIRLAVRFATAPFSNSK